MAINTDNLEQNLLESSAGRAVFDSLVQANVNLNTIPVETVKEMLLAECRYQARHNQLFSQRLSYC